MTQADILAEILKAHHAEGKTADSLHAVRATQVFLCTGGVLYFVWLFVARWAVDTANDPWWVRAAIGALCFSAALVLFRPEAQRHKDHILTGLSTLASAHLVLLAMWNGFVQFYLLSLVIVVACSGVVLADFASFFVYTLAVAVVGLAGACFQIDVAAPVCVQVAIAFVTLQTVSFFAIWRRIKLQAVAVSQASGARDFLQKLINAIPDPVFVKTGQGQWLMVNDAFRRYTDDRTIDVLRQSNSELRAIDDNGPLRRIAAGPDGAWVEQDLALDHDEDNRKTLAAKVASANLIGGQVFQVGVIRDVTERKELERALEQKVMELQSAQKQVRRLEGLLPICMHCGRIRCEDSEWEELETYIENHSSVSFSHVLCAYCLDKHHPVAAGGS